MPHASVHESTPVRPSRSRSTRLVSLWLGLAASSAVGVALGVGALDPADAPGADSVLGYNDLGMHCMNSDYSEMMILPPYNTIRAQVIRRGVEPDIIESGLTVEYWLPSNTHSSDKSNFWKYPGPLLGNPLPDVGVAGFGMIGTMAYVSATRDWAAIGVPVIPVDDDGRENAYPLAEITVKQGSTVLARTRAVVPVSTEMSCNLCHVSSEPGVSVAGDILKDHDRLHGTNLFNQRPVSCAACHSDNALGAPGAPGVSSLSSAMHSAHASRVGSLSLNNSCYACHPGVRTNCQRDVHAGLGITCVSCHGDMAAVGNPSRRPWLDEPRCATCHSRPGFEFEQAGKLFKESVGHGGIQCVTCHSSPHAITPAVTALDNVQSNIQQGHAGMINNCTVCHTSPPGSFFHRREN